MRRLAGALLMLGILAGPVAAQDSTRAVPAAADSLAPRPAPDTLRPPAAAADTVPLIRPPVTPMGAFWRSLLIPGWGQAKLGRRTAGALFLGFEGVALGMTIGTSVQLNYLKETNSARVDSKSAQHEDWLVLLGLNHLLAAMEAYVSAHLWDFPGDLTIQAAPGGFSGSMSVPVRLP